MDMRYLTLDKALDAWRKIQPISDDDKARLARRFSVDFNYNSNHIEGNTLTYGQTEILLLFGKVIGEANVRSVQEMVASEVSLKMMEAESRIKESPLTQNFIRGLHRTLLREDYEVHRTLPDGMQIGYTVHAGQYKTRPNSVITRYGDRFEYASPEETPALMTDLVDWYNEAEKEGRLSPIELAALFHYRYIRIHPFEDGNGRIARLLVNYILAKHDIPMIVIRSRKKTEYLEALHSTDLAVGSAPSDGAKASIQSISPFLRYFRNIVAQEVYADVLFVTKRGENRWWYDGECIEFRTPNYGKILNMMQSEPVLTLADIQRKLGLQPTSVKKLVQTLIDKHYVEKGKDEGSWHVFIVPSC
ncbi:Fic family protein [Hallerella porci]|uniref:Fic family protein n=2 Tax=Fibrobacterales TaxID=218872 RepID=A0ABX5LI06_9BACT|nr:Fic family protein [Hallerella porci]PWK93089.1 Fic family protein [Hallerella porci]